jgi:hypothetical protein
MKTKDKIVKEEIVELKFKVDPKFRDPLLSENIFQEIEVEENKYYYQVHLGYPINRNDDD